MSTQRENIVGGHLAGRDITVNNYGTPTESFMARLRQKFEDECAKSLEFKSTIDALRYYQDPIEDVPIGLQMKLELGLRHSDVPEALRAKELFAKCMARHSLSQTSQEVIAYCLGQIRHLFRARVTPLIRQGAELHQIDAAVFDQVINPVQKELEGNFLGIMPQELQGMIYYLTGNCFLDWHNHESEANVSPGA